MLEHMNLLLKVRLLSIWRRKKLMVLLLIIPILATLLITQMIIYSEYKVHDYANIDGKLNPTHTHHLFFMIKTFTFFRSIYLKHKATNP